MAPAGIRTIERRLGPPQPGQQQAYLLGLSTDDFGQAIVAIGNPDTADNVVTFVPGTYSSLGGAAGGLDKVENMVDTANRIDPGARAAGIVWIGYDAPQSLGEAGDVSYAHRAARTSIASRTGCAPLTSGRRRTIRSSRTATVPPWPVSPRATRADNDVIGHAYDHTDLRTPVHPLVPTNVPNPDPDLAHGNDPTDADFDTRVFGSDAGTPMWRDPQAAHMEYWDPETKSLRNFGRIIAGRPDLVTQ